jgi:hypothetical protein
LNGASVVTLWPVAGQRILISRITGDLSCSMSLPALLQKRLREDGDYRSGQYHLSARKLASAEKIIRHKLCWNLAMAAEMYLLGELL